MFGDWHHQMHEQMEEMDKQMREVFRIFRIPDVPSGMEVTLKAKQVHNVLAVLNIISTDCQLEGQIFRLV